MQECEYHLQMLDIHKHFGGIKALSCVSLFVKRGEIHGLLGENGAGKSTLIKVLSGAYCADAGEILINGKKVNITNTKAGIEHGISVIYQEFALVPHISVAENIYFDDFRTKHSLIDWKALNRKASKLLKELGFESIDPKEKAGNLKIAHQQVVEICKALSRNASILVLDEPTAVLTLNETTRLFELIMRLKKKRVSIIYITHRLEEVYKITDKITVLKDGAFVKTINTSDINEEELVNLMIGRKLESYFPKRVSKIGDEIFRVEHIKSGTAVKDISFSLRKGEVLGLSGLVGSGRTEAVRAIFGLDKLESGKIFHNGNRIKIGSTKRAYKQGIGMLPEDRKKFGVLLKQSIRNNLTLSCLKKFNIGLGILNLKKEKKYTDGFAGQLGIKGAKLDDLVSILSGGNQQKVAIGRVLASDSKVLFLDEPTRGVDVGSKIEIFNIINSMVAQDYTVLFISSEMTEIMGMCDRVIVIREGISVGELSSSELNEENIIKLSMGVAANESK